MTSTNTIDIMGTDVSIKEYKGQRVVTLKDIDAVHGRPDGTARKRFNDNKKHFVEGVDYFIVTQPSEIRTLGIIRPQGGASEKIILVTEMGYLMIVKSFKDDLSWEVQRSLVNTYFKVKEFVKDANPYSCAYAQAKDRISLWKRKVSNPLIERIILLTGVEDFVSAYAFVYKEMRKSYGFDMNKAKFDFCRHYDAAYENCSVIDRVADSSELRKGFESCAAELITDLSRERVEHAERVAERKIREAKDFATYSEEVVEKALRSSLTLDSQYEGTDSSCNCLM